MCVGLCACEAKGTGRKFFVMGTGNCNMEEFPEFREKLKMDYLSGISYMTPLSKGVGKEVLDSCHS